METFSGSYLTLLLIGWLAIVVLGAILGVKQRITVFRNYNDLGLAFLVTLSPVALFYIFSFVTGGLDTLATYVIIGIEALLLSGSSFAHFRITIALSWRWWHSLLKFRYLSFSSSIFSISLRPKAKPWPSVPR